MTVQPVLPWWLWAPLAAAGVLFLGWRLVRSAKARTPGQVREWVFRSALVLLVAVAALRPGIPGGSNVAATSDLNVFFVVDTSSSIVAEDFGSGAPRLDGARQDIMAIAEQLPGARFALLTFDSNAVVRMPLTTDTTALATLVSVLEPQVTAYSKGSSVTVAGPLLAERLEAARNGHPERPRLVFYLGDGEQTSGSAPRALGIGRGLVDGGAVLGYGTPEGGRMKENTGQTTASRSYIQDRTPGAGKDAVSVIDEVRLREIARELGVPYVHRSAGDSTAPMLEHARRGEIQRPADGAGLAGRTELYWILAAGAFLLGLREIIQVLRQWRQLRPAPQPGTGVRT